MSRRWSNCCKASGLDLDGLAGEEAPLAFLFEPDEKDGEVGVAGFAAVVGGCAEGVADPGGVADDLDGLVGEVDGDEVGGFVEEGFFEGRFVLEVAIGVAIGEFVEDEGVEGCLVRVDEGLAEGFYGGGHGLFVFGLREDRGGKG